MTTFFEHQKTSYKKNYLRNLILVAAMDGHLDEEEKTLIYKIGLKRGLKQWQITELLESAKPAEVFLPESITNRMNLLFDLMQIIYIDGRMSPKEVEFMRSIVGSFELHPVTIEQLIELFLNQMPTAVEWKHFVDNYIDNNN